MFVVSILGREAVLLRGQEGTLQSGLLGPNVAPTLTSPVALGMPLNLLSLSFLLSNEGNMRTFLIGFMRTKK